MARISEKPMCFYLSNKAELIVEKNVVVPTTRRHAGFATLRRCASTTLGKRMMKYTKIVAAIYGIWFLFWLSIASYGALFTNHGEFGVSAHLWLIISGLPNSLFSLSIKPNGSVFAVIVAGVIGLLQWCIIAEVIARQEKNRSQQNK